MNIVALKFVCKLSFWLMFILLCTYSSIAQSIDNKAVNGEIDLLNQYKNSFQKTPSSKWTIINKKKKLKITNEIGTAKNDFLGASTAAMSRKEVIPKKKNKGADKDSVSLTDTLKRKEKNKHHVGKEVEEKANKNGERITTIFPNKMQSDTLENNLPEKFSKGKIEKKLKNSLLIGDYEKGSEKRNSTKQRESVFFSKSKREIEKRLGLKEKNDSVKTMKDTLKHVTFPEKLAKQIGGGNVKGSLSLGYEYGVLPYAAADKYPLGAFKSEGRFSVIMLKLPVEVSYRYTTVKSVIGINNYFRISYDVNRYKEELDKKMLMKDQLKKIQLDSLHLYKQDIAKKMDYIKMLMEMNIPDFSLPDTSLNLGGKFPLQLPNGIDSSKGLTLLKRKGDYLHKKDSILQLTNEYKAKYDKYKTKYDSVSLVIEKIQAGAEGIKKMNPKQEMPDVPFKKMLEKALKNIKKFEIGLCNPSYSLFLLSNAPLKGINLEYATEESFFAVTYGTTINTIFYNPNTLQGKLQGARNLYNFFDYSDLSSGRKILAVKGGKGQKEGTHLFVGLLVGRGKMDYMNAIDPKFGKKESNLVAEVDGKYKFSQILSGEFIFGKSSLQSEDVSLEQIKKSFNELFSSYRSNAMQAKINYDINKTKTKFQFTGRIIDPYFKSFGVSFLRSDNIRYELKADQVITKNIKYSIAYRREEDNLLGLINYKNTFTTITNSLSVRFKKGISLRLNYAPLLRTLRNGNVTIIDRNSISTGVLSYAPKMKNVQVNYNILYSKYRITSDSGTIHFDNLTYSHQFQFKNGFKTGMNASWFENTLKDTLGNNTYLGVVDIAYTTEEQNSFTIGGKVAYKPNTLAEYGFIAKATLKIYKSLFWEAEVEKILTGDYYSDLIDSKIKRFPYYMSGKLIINF